MLLSPSLFPPSPKTIISRGDEFERARRGASGADADGAERECERRTKQQ